MKIQTLLHLAGDLVEELDIDEESMCEILESIYDARDRLNSVTDSDIEAAA